MTGAVGTVAELWRYPVKSMQGERVPGATLTARGLAGDRAYAVLERATGHVASAKHPAKWARLLECRAEFTFEPVPGSGLPPVRITLPDRTVVTSDDPAVDAALSALLGREVSLTSETPDARPTREADRTDAEAPTGAPRLIRYEEMALAAPPGTFFDYAPVHVLTTATLAALTERHPAGRFDVRRFDVRRFRPNVVVAVPAGPGFVENGWLGRALAFGGDGARLELIDPCPRCVVTTLAQADLPRDVEVLRTVARNNSAASVTLAPGLPLPAVAGAYGRMTGGAVTVSVGDPVYLI